MDWFWRCDCILECITANPDLDGTGTDAEILWYEHWDNFVNENVQRDGHRFDMGLNS